ncbi:hypothetical protein A3K73_05930 [Candidatus Pacearchaeota archaeon RBG_13_36_9]|nr:MAG: hypothetical protein A3K73_05930 [Candidatus Pacearchaeota archaeon RBG_13_36_9]
MAWIRKNRNGYPINRNGDLIHRNVAEKKIKRPLRDGEVVHHQDGDKTNFRRSNLSVMSRPFHSKLHNRMKKRRSFWD